MSTLPLLIHYTADRVAESILEIQKHKSEGSLSTWLCTPAHSSFASKLLECTFFFSFSFHFPSMWACAQEFCFEIWGLNNKTLKARLRAARLLFQRAHQGMPCA